MQGMHPTPLGNDGSRSGKPRAVRFVRLIGFLLRHRDTLKMERLHRLWYSNIGAPTNCANGL